MDDVEMIKNKKKIHHTFSIIYFHLMCNQHAYKENILIRIYICQQGKNI